MKFDYNQFKVPEDVSVSLKMYATKEDGGLKKKSAKIELKSNTKELKQDRKSVV